MEQLAQSEANRKSVEEKIRQLTVHQNSAVRKCFNPLCPKNDQLQFSPNSISKKKKKKVLRIDEMVAKREML